MITPTPPATPPADSSDPPANSSESVAPPQELPAAPAQEPGLAPAPPALPKNWRGTLRHALGVLGLGLITGAADDAPYVYVADVPSGFTGSAPRARPRLPQCRNDARRLTLTDS
jgi:hypothetical protein